MTNPNPYPTMLFLNGPQPFQAEMWCAVCAMLYHGVASTEPTMRMQAQEKFNKAAQRELAIAFHDQTVKEVAPNVYKFPSGRLVSLFSAITIAPSVHFPHALMPVCWQHLQGFDPTNPVETGNGQAHKPSGLIKGKKYDVPKGGQAA